MLFTDLVTQTLEQSIVGVRQRSRVSADNIANINTPGFRSQRVLFESSLAAALKRGAPATAQTTLVAANTPVGLNGNDVSLEEETVQLEKAGMQFDALVQALNFKFGLLRTAIDAR